ncbi:MAG: PepSY-associated TM helix domain-containing protein, partial [Bacteroidota bacterium]
MKINKKLLFKIHGWIGIKLSILFFIVCLSGTLATISHELDWLFNPAIRAIPQETLASKNTLIGNIQKVFPDGEILFISATPEPYICNIAQIKTGKQRYFVFANQYTGEVQGYSKLTIQRYLRDLHYYLFIPFQVGHFTVLIFAFMLLISTLTALLFYKRWWKKLFVLKRGKGPVVLFRSLHRLVGIWSVPFTILFSITGIWYFAERTNTANISKIANTKAPLIDTLEMDSLTFAKLHYTIDYDRVVQQAQLA